MLLKPEKKVYVQVYDGTKTTSSSFTVYDTDPQEFCRTVRGWLSGKGRRSESRLDRKRPSAKV